MTTRNRVSSRRSMLFLALLCLACCECLAADKYELPNVFTVYSGRTRTRGMTADFLVHPDGVVLMAYTQNCQESGLPELKKAKGDAILARRSEDKGKSWGRPFVLQAPSDDGGAIAQPSLLALPNAEMLFAYNWIKGSRDGRVYLRRSRDGGQTWQGRTLVTPHSGYHTMCPGCLLRLSSGRIIASVDWVADYEKKWHSSASPTTPMTMARHGHGAPDPRTWARRAKSPPWSNSRTDGF